VEVPTFVAQSSPKLVILIRPTPDRRRLPEMMTWVRWLLPAAILLVAPAKLPESSDTEVIQIDCADGYDGPLSVASMLARRLPR
jgi:hypothetical protein